MRSKSRRGYKAAHCSLFIATPQSRLAPCQLPVRGAFWCGANSNQKLSPQAGKVDTNGVAERGTARRYQVPRYVPLPSRLTPRHLPRKRGRLKLQHKLGVQCRTPRGAIVSIPITPPSYTPARASVRFWLLRHQHRLKARAQDSARQAPSCSRAHRPFSARFGLSSHLC